MSHRYARTIATEAEIAQAQALRAERDQRYGDHFPGRPSDAKWVGDLGELLAARWFASVGIPARWVTEDPTRNPDFILSGGAGVEVKTSKRAGRPLPYWDVGVTAAQIDHPGVDWLLFASYSLATRCLWILGLVEIGEFRRIARRYEAGQAVHSGYTVREGHSILNVRVSQLTPPADWLRAKKAA